MPSRRATGRFIWPPIWKVVTGYLTPFPSWYGSVAINQQDLPIRRRKSKDDHHRSQPIAPIDVEISHSHLNENRHFIAPRAVSLRGVVPPPRRNESGVRFRGGRR